MIDIITLLGRGRSGILEAEEQLGRGLGGGRIHEDSPGAGSLQYGYIHLSPSVQLMLNSLDFVKQN